MKKHLFTIAIAALTVATLFTGCDRKAREVRPRVEEAIECMNKNDYNCAIKLLDKATQTYESADLYLLLGEAYRGKREATPQETQWLSREITALLKSVSLNGKNIRSLKFLAEAYFAGANYQKAKETYQLILPLKPQDYETKEIQGMIAECDRIITDINAPPPPPPAYNPGDEVYVPQQP